MAMSFYAAAVRPLLFCLSADRGHALAQAVLRWGRPWQAFGSLAGLEVNDPRLRTRFAGIEFRSPVGLAAGFDKNCDCLDALSWLGFGFITVGSIMPEPRYGNPFPRLVRYPDTKSLADSMGVPSKGIDYATARLAECRHHRVPIIANIGGFTAGAIAHNFHSVGPYVEAVEISLMCPNTTTREGFDELQLLADVLDRIAGHQTPAVVRVPNDTAQSPDRLAELVERCVAAGVAGLKVGGGRPIAESKLGTGQGTLHGRAIHATALANVERAARIARGRIPIKGNGGVFGGSDVLAMLRAGACCVDLYSAFVYEGWSIAGTINRQLVSALDSHAASSLDALASATSDSEVFRDIATSSGSCG
jgi:dihydroorotate dehydrogenase